MKKILAFIVLMFHFVAFSQENVNVFSGYITFNSNTTFEFKNMTIENGSVTYFNEVSQTVMKFSLGAVKKIVNNHGQVIYESGKVAVRKLGDQEIPVKVITQKKPVVQQLVYKSSSNIMLNGETLSSDEVTAMLKSNPEIYKQYRKGQNGATFGIVMIGTGIGLFVGGGISNLSNANNGSKGSPVLLIAGIITGVVGIPVRLGGVKNIKQAVKDYNALPAREVSFLEKSEVKVIAGAGGVGFRWQF